jgi:ribose 1,5-bisphosphate isomerase
MADKADEVSRIMHDIKTLNIQGARRVAQAAAKALVIAAKRSKAERTDKLIWELETVSNKLISLRPTEPMVRNTLKYFMAYIEDGRSVGEMKRIAGETERRYDKEFTENFNRIVEYGSSLIGPGSTVLTHCHSTTVNSILIRANRKKRIKVFATETRPRFQGHLTAKQLSAAGVDVTLTVDSAVGYVMKNEHPDLVAVGSDAISSQGHLYNKIGTSVIALLADAYNVPFYSATQLYKFDPISKWGKMTQIEMRPTSEVLKTRIRGVKVLNPAFDITDAKRIEAYITEAGIIPPQGIMRAAEKYGKLDI